VRASSIESKTMPALAVGRCEAVPWRPVTPRCEDVDLGSNPCTVRSGEGHGQARARWVELPAALSRKYPNAARE